MKKIHFLMLLMLFAGVARANGEIKFERMTWKEAKAKAAKENKMIFFDAFTTWCGPCQYLEESVYTDAAVARYFNENFINVKFDMEDGEGIDLAEEFGITAYPTLLFFSADGKLVHKYIGAMKAADFVNLGKNAQKPSEQYYFLKNKVIQGQASQAEFIKWADMAEQLEDEDRADIAANWLSRLDDILGNRELAKVTMEQSRVTEAQLHYLYENKDRIAALLQWDMDKIQSSLYRKMFNLALANQEGGVRGNAFETTIASFDKGMINYARKDLEIFNAINDDRDIERVVEIFRSALAGPNRLSLEEFCNLLIDYSPYLETAQVQNILPTLESYRFNAADKGKECWLYLAQLVCYSKAGDTMNAKAVGMKAYQHENTPASYKKILKETFGIN